MFWFPLQKMILHVSARLQDEAVTFYREKKTTEVSFEKSSRDICFLAKNSFHAISKLGCVLSLVKMFCILLEAVHDTASIGIARDHAE